MDRIKDVPKKKTKNTSLKYIALVVIILVTIAIADHHNGQSINEAKETAYKAGYITGFNAGVNRGCGIGYMEGAQSRQFASAHSAH